MSSWHSPIGKCLNERLLLENRKIQAEQAADRICFFNGRFANSETSSCFSQRSLHLIQEEVHHANDYFAPRQSVIGLITLKPIGKFCDAARTLSVVLER